MKIFLDAMAHIPHVSVGDHALIWGATEILRRAFKDVTFSFLCKFPEHERIYLEKMDFSFEIVRRSHRQLIAGFQARKLAQASDLIVSAWGDGFITYPPHRMCRKVYCLKTKHAPLALCSSSMGPFATSGPKKWLAKAALRQYDCLSVRDTITHKFVKELGIENVDLVPDTAIALRPCASERVDEILVAEGIPVGMPFVGFNLGIEFMTFCEKNDINYRKVCVEVIEHIRNVLKCSVILIPHQYVYEDYDYRDIPHIRYDLCDDRYAIGKVWDALPSHAGVYRIKCIYSCAELKGIIGRSEVFLCQRIHPSVASTSLCVPTVIMHYTHKAKGMMDLLGKAEYVWCPEKLVCGSQDDTSTRRLLQLVDRLWDERHQYRKELQNIMPDIIHKAFAFGDSLANIVHKRAS